MFGRTRSKYVRVCWLKGGWYTTRIKLSTPFKITVDAASHTTSTLAVNRKQEIDFRREVNCQLSEPTRKREVIYEYDHQRACLRPDPVGRRGFKRVE